MTALTTVQKQHENDCVIPTQNVNIIASVEKKRESYNLLVRQRQADSE